MNITIITEKLKEANLLDHKIEKFTFLINEKSEEQGAIFFVPAGGREYKFVLSAPFHKDIIQDGETKSYKQLLNHKQAILLK